METDISGAEDIFVRHSREETRKKLREYVRNQLQEDLLEDQITLKEYVDRLRASRSNKANKRPL